MTYSKSTGFVPNSDGATSGQQFMAVDYRESSFDFAVDDTLSGNFTSGAGRFTRIGNVVTMTIHQTMAHPSDFNPNSAAGFIPRGFRPTRDIRNTYYYFSTAGLNTIVTPDGIFSNYYIDETVVVNFLNTVVGFSVTWHTADA